MSRGQSNQASGQGLLFGSRKAKVLQYLEDDRPAPAFDLDTEPNKCLGMLKTLVAKDGWRFEMQNKAAGETAVYLFNVPVGYLIYKNKQGSAETAFGTKHVLINHSSKPSLWNQQEYKGFSLGPRELEGDRAEHQRILEDDLRRLLTKAFLEIQ